MAACKMLAMSMYTWSQLLLKQETYACLWFLANHELKPGTPMSFNVAGGTQSPRCDAVIGHSAYSSTVKSKPVQQ